MCSSDLTNPILQWNEGQKKRHPKEYAAAQEAQQAAMQRQQNAVQQAYMPYKQGETYQTDAQGNLISGGAAQGSAAVAGFSPMQLQAMNAARQLQVPGQFAQGTNYVNQAAQGSLGIAGLAPGLAASAQGYGSAAADIGQQAWAEIEPFLLGDHSPEANDEQARIAEGVMESLGEVLREWAKSYRPSDDRQASKAFDLPFTPEKVLMNLYCNDGDN